MGGNIPEQPGHDFATRRPEPLMSTRTAPSWSGTAQNPWMPLILVLVLGQGAVVTLLLGKPPSNAAYVNLAHVFTLVLLELFAKVRVTVDPAEIGIRYGYVGWLRQRIAMDRVRAAHAVQIGALEHGGWGYRGGLRLFGRASVVIRGGPGVRLDLESDKHLSITVDDAQNAARLINALIARRLAEPSPEPQSPDVGR
jgi:hypothetical protein